MKAWRNAFVSAGASGDDFTTDGELAAEDLIASRVLELLQADPKLVAIFGSNAIERMETRPALDFKRTFPRLQVYSSTTNETQAPTSTDVDLVRLYVGIRFDALQVEPLRAYEASIATVRRRIATVLKANKTLIVRVNGSVDVPIANEMQTGSWNPIYDVSPFGDERIAGTLELAFTYRVKVDHRTQRIDSLSKNLP